MEGRPLEDADLIALAKGADADAYAELVRRYQEVAFRTAYLVTRDAGDAEEAAQDAFVKAYRTLSRFRSGAAFRPWLLRIVANEARNRRRASGRRSQLAMRAALSRPSAGAAPSAEATVLAEATLRGVLDALDRLRDPDRMVITCRYFLDLPEADIAQVLGVPRGTVKSRLSRALGRLRNEVGELRDE